MRQTVSQLLEREAQLERELQLEKLRIDQEGQRHRLLDKELGDLEDALGQVIERSHAADIEVTDRKIRQAQQRIAEIQGQLMSVRDELGGQRLQTVAPKTGLSQLLEAIMSGQGGLVGFPSLAPPAFVPQPVDEDLQDDEDEDEEAYLREQEEIEEELEEDTQAQPVEAIAGPDGDAGTTAEQAPIQTGALERLPNNSDWCTYCRLWHSPSAWANDNPWFAKGPGSWATTPEPVTVPTIPAEEPIETRRAGTPNPNGDGSVWCRGCYSGIDGVRGRYHGAFGQEDVDRQNRFLDAEVAVAAEA